MLLGFLPFIRKNMEMRGIEPRAFHMQSERSTTELHPLDYPLIFRAPQIRNWRVAWQASLRD